MKLQGTLCKVDQIISYTKLLRIPLSAKNRHLLTPNLINNPPILKLNFQSSGITFYFNPPRHFKILRKNIHPL